jgi:hypothetical protein
MGHQLSWEVEDRPDTVGALVPSIDEDCQRMKGFAVSTPQNTGVTEACPIAFKRYPFRRYAWYRSESTG